MPPVAVDHGQALAGPLFGLRRCKTHAARLYHRARAGLRWLGRANTPSDCVTLTLCRAGLAQGKPLNQPGRRARLLAAAVLATGLGAGPTWAAPPFAAASAPAAGCAADAPRLVALGPGTWLVPAASGDATPANRGQVSNLLLVADGDRLWLLGSGPSTAFGQALACVLARDLGRVVSDVVSPWARPELVLGLAGLDPAGSAAHWAHADVAEAMRLRCTHCVARLRQRLAARADDLSDDPVRLPQQRLAGEQGRLGPFGWWRLARAPGETVTVWHLARERLWLAPGLLNGEGPADGREADLPTLAASVERLHALAAADGSAARFIGEQGAEQGADLPARHLAYWRGLRQRVLQAMDEGGGETAAPGRWPELPEAWADHPWHALNWQHAWRVLEPVWLAAPR